MITERRFLTGFRSADADTPGLVQEDDGTVWLVAPDGTRTQISGGGSSSAVGCVLQSALFIDVHDIGDYPLNWVALFSDIYNQDPLGALPAGIGLTAAFDGSDNTIETTEAGIWSFSYSVQLSAEDATWEGWLDYSGDISYQDYPILPEYRTFTHVLPLAAGSFLHPRLRTIQAATADPFDLGVVYLSLCRLG